MAELIPHPFGALVTRMFTELETEKSIFDYPQKKFFIGQSGRDYSVKFHGKIALRHSARLPVRKRKWHKI
jgi:hypothetical protein